MRRTRGEPRGYSALPGGDEHKPRFGEGQHGRGTRFVPVDEIPDGAANPEEAYLAAEAGKEKKADRTDARNKMYRLKNPTDIPESQKPPREIHHGGGRTGFGGRNAEKRSSSYS
jgi:hypothetical protein